MSRLKYHLVPVTAFSQNCSLITCLETQQTVVVDPGGDVEKIQHALEAAGLTPAKILLTHGHLDHVGAATALASHYSIPIIGPHSADEFLFDALPVQSQMFGLAHCEAFLPDQWLNEGDTVTVGECQLHVLHCPGHSPGHIVFYHAPSQLLISGDVLFRGGVGRSDLPGGDHQQLIASITEKLLPLGDDVTFIPGHGPVSTLGVEKQSNPFLA